MRKSAKGQAYEADDDLDAIAIGRAFGLPPWEVAESLTGEWYDKLNVYFDEMAKAAKPSKKR